MASGITGSSKTTKAIIEGLKESPLFNLSLASKELFHSNFIAWLLEAYPNKAGKIFSDFMWPKSKDGKFEIDKVNIERESQHFDLLIPYKKKNVKGSLIIENKVKSIPSLEQLKEYAEKAFSKYENPSFLLLSMMSPSFSNDKQGNSIEVEIKTKKTGRKKIEWKVLYYGQLIENIKSLIPHCDNLIEDRKLPSNERARIVYHRGLISDYLQFTQGLWQLKEENSFGSDLEPLYIAEQRELLQKRGIFDFLEKLRYDQVKCKLMETAKTKFGNDKVNEHSTSSEMTTKHLYFESGFTNGAGLVGFKYCVDSYKTKMFSVAIGVQIQGLQFRVFLEVYSHPKDKKNKNAKRQDCEKIADVLAEHVRKDWFFPPMGCGKDKLLGNLKARDKNKFKEFGPFRYLSFDFDERTSVVQIVNWTSGLIDRAIEKCEKNDCPLKNIINTNVG